METDRANLCRLEEQRYSALMPDNQKIEDLGDWAEDRFALYCSQAGVIANKSNKDRTGWDYLLEFPQPNSGSVPPDLHKTEATARAQVKSNEKGKPKTRLKLSNAHRFAASPDPCFLILAAPTNGGEPVRFYAKHFWKPEIERTLKRLRESEKKGKPPNQQWLNITLSEADDHTHDLIEWMRSIVLSQSRATYSNEKHRLNMTLGYEDGQYVGTVTFAQNKLETFVDHSIGLTDHMDVEHMKMVEKRFGIEGANPLFEGRPHLASIQSLPSPCKIEVVGSDDVVHRLDGELYRPGLRGLPLDLLKVRAVAGPLEIVMSGSGPTTAHFSILPKVRRELHFYATCLAALRVMTSGPSEVTVVFDDVRAPCTNTHAIESEHKSFLIDASYQLAALSRVASQADGKEVQISIANVFDHWDAILEFRRFTDASRIGFALDADHDETLAAIVEKLLLHATLDIGHVRFSVMVVLSLNDDVVEEGERRLGFTDPRIIAAFVDDRSAEEHGELLQAEKTRYLKRHPKGIATVQWNASDSEHAVFVNDPSQNAHKPQIASDENSD